MNQNLREDAMMGEAIASAEISMNTPDTEWEKDLRIRYRSQTLKMAEEVSETGDYSKVEGMIVDWWLKELTSRDTYWKERIVAIINDIDAPEGAWREALTGFKQVLISAITNEDNLK